MEEIRSGDKAPLFDNIDFNTNDQDYEIFESAVQQVKINVVSCCMVQQSFFFWDQNNAFRNLFFSYFKLQRILIVKVLDVLCLLYSSLLNCCGFYDFN